MGLLPLKFILEVKELVFRAKTISFGLLAKGSNKLLYPRRFLWQEVLVKPRLKLRPAV